MLLRVLFLTTALLPCNALAQSTDMARSASVREPANVASGKLAASSSPSIEVRKTAFVDGAEVRGIISITNTGRETVTVTEIIDWLEYTSRAA